MNRPVRSTVVFAMGSGFVVVPLAIMLHAYLPWPAALKLALWTDLALYGVLLARWSGTRLLSVLFPLAVLLGVALWPQAYNGFFMLALGVFSWIRSGICFQNAPVRALMAEAITVVGGSAMLLFFGSQGYAAWALNICLFFLFQSLYFFMVPWRARHRDPEASQDAFEDAVAEARRILDGV